MLSLAEELLLLALDDERGVIADRTPLKYGYVGAILMDLALIKRVDTDLEHLMVIDKTPTGDDVRDEILAILAQSSTNKGIGYWIITLSQRSREIEQRLLERLIKRRILKKEEHRILWVFARRRYPVQDNREETEVKTRIRRVVLSDSIPDPRDTVLISLIKNCYLIDEVFSEEEIPAVEKRIDQIARMDLIGQTLSRIIESIVQAIAMTPPYF